MSSSIDPNSTNPMQPGSGGPVTEQNMQPSGPEVERMERPPSEGRAYDRYPDDRRYEGGRYEDPYYGRGYDDPRQRERGHDRRPDYYDRPHGRSNDDSGFAEGASRFARQHLRTGETKEFFKTSEFFVTVIGVAALIIAAAAQDTFDAPGMWRLVTALLIAYVVSRGIAKAGTDKRDRGNDRP